MERVDLRGVRLGTVGVAWSGVVAVAVKIEVNRIESFLGHGIDRLMKGLIFSEVDGELICKE